MKLRALVKQGSQALIIASSVAVASNSFAAGNWYAGIDIAQMASEVTYSWNDTIEYKTTHLRFKGGYEFLNWLAFEAQLLTNGEDENDGTTLTNPTEYNTGATFGAYVKPHATLGIVDLYALAGFATATATIDCRPSCPPEWESTLDGPSYGAGLQFSVNDNLRISADYMVYFDDDATYDDGVTTPFTVDQKNTAFGIGINYAFK